jgi:hypothetical protein
MKPVTFDYLHERHNPESGAPQPFDTSGSKLCLYKRDH